MSEIKLLPCPFCNAELKRWDYMPDVFFEHPYNGCILSGKKVVENEHDVKAWNTRKLMERIIERLEEESRLYSLNDRECEFAIRQDQALRIVEEVGGIE